MLATTGDNLTNADSHVLNQGTFGLMALPDMDGDGKFEVAAWDFGYEWTSLTIYSWVDRKLVSRAEAWCGS